MEVTLEYIYSDASIERSERVIWLGARGYEVDPSETIYTDASFGEDNFMVAGEFYTPTLNAQSRWSRTETDIHDASIHVKVTPTDNLTIDFDIQTIDSESNIMDYSISNQMRPVNSWHPNGTWVPTDVVYDRSTFNQVTTAAFELRGSDIAGVNFPDATTNPSFPEQSFIYNMMDKEEQIEAESTAIALDVEYALDGGWLTSVKSGFYMSEKEQLAKDSDWNWGEVSTPWAGWWDNDTSTWWTIPFEGSYLYHPEYFEEYTFAAGDFHGGGVLAGDQAFLFPTMDSVRNFSATNAQYEADMPYSNSSTDLAGREGTIGKYLPSEITDTSEDRLEVYVQGNYEFDDLTYPIKGNFGLRYVSWQVESTGGALFPEVYGWDEAANIGAGAFVAANFPDEFAFSNRTQTALGTVKGDKYTNVLPSFNMSVAWSDDVITRFAISESIYLPLFRYFRNYQNISRSTVYDYSLPGTDVITDINFSGMSGNPLIEPEESLNTDITFEWYFSESGSFTTSLFHKEVDNIIRRRLFTVNVANPENDVVQPVDFQMWVNTDGGSVQGIELAYVQFYDFLPGAFSGLGFSANFTHIDQSGLNDSKGFGEGSAGEGGRNSFRAFTNLDLPGYSDDNVNVALMYEKYGVSARLAYSWRSDYLLTRRDADHFAPVVAQETGQLDLSVSYTFLEDFKVGMEVSNLTDEIIKTELMYNQEGRQTTRNQFKTDRRLGFYAQFKF